MCRGRVHGKVSGARDTWERQNYRAALCPFRRSLRCGYAKLLSGHLRSRARRTGMTAGISDAGETLSAARAGCPIVRASVLAAASRPPLWYEANRLVKHRLQREKLAIGFGVLGDEGA